MDGARVGVVTVSADGDVRVVVAVQVHELHSDTEAVVVVESSGQILAVDPRVSEDEVVGSGGARGRRDAKEDAEKCAPIAQEQDMPDSQSG